MSECEVNKTQDFHNTEITLRKVSLRERYEDCLKSSIGLKQQVLEVTTEKQLQEVLEKLETFLKQVRQGVNLTQLYGWVGDLRGEICALRMGDSTRSELAELMEEMNHRIRQLIDEEMKKDRIKRIRNFLNECANHADEIVEILGEDNSFFG